MCLASCRLLVALKAYWLPEVALQRRDYQLLEAGRVPAFSFLEVFFVNEVPISLLKPHPKNADYYDDLPDEKYQEVKRSIEAHGIRDPLKVTPNYTVIAGHQRLKIAKELGFEKVPVVILDVTPEEAEYLLIADNEERRQGDGDNPMKKARRAKFLKEYWDVRQGKKRQNVVESSGKSILDVAEAIGEDERTTQRLLKLNDLIPNLQTLVANGKLTQTAAHSLAFLPPEEQEHLLKTLGESGICGLSVKEAQGLRRQVEAAIKERDELAGKLAEAEDREQNLERQLAIVNSQMEDLETELKEKLGREYQEKLQSELSRLKKQLADLQAEKQQAERSVIQLKAKIKELQSAPPKVVEKVVEKVPEDYHRIKKELREKNEELLSLTRAQIELKDRYKIRDMFSDLVQAVGKHMRRIELEIGGHAGDPEVCRCATECAAVLERAAREVKSWVIVREGGVVIEADFAAR